MKSAEAIAAGLLCREAGKEIEMPVYLVIEARIRDQHKYEQYTEGLSAILPRYRGRYLVHGGRVVPLNEGLSTERRQPGRFLVLEFPSEFDLRRCWASSEYQAIMPLGHAGAETRAVLLEGAS
jgi:uncharacterized protein (DUF1330 family)